MVGFHGVRSPEIRQLLVDYLVRRAGDTDYVTREGLARVLAADFWNRIEAMPSLQPYSGASPICAC